MRILRLPLNPPAGFIESVLLPLIVPWRGPAAGARDRCASPRIVWVIGCASEEHFFIASLTVAMLVLFWVTARFIQPPSAASWTGARLAWARRTTQLTIRLLQTVLFRLWPRAGQLRRETYPWYQQRADEIDLANGVTIGVWPCTFRAVRGLTIGVAICDEIDFWYQESVNAGEEVIAALRPALASIPQAKLIAISSPYTPLGWLAQFHKAFWGQDGSPKLVWQAPSRVMNPTLDPAKIQAAIAEDPDRARAEWDAVWRAGVSAFLDPVLVDACVRREPLVLPPMERPR